MKNKTSLLCLILLILLFSCDLFDDDSNSDDPDSSISSLLANLPDFNVDLPDSLQGGSGSRSPGDVDILDGGVLEGVKSQAWAELNSTFNAENAAMSNNISQLFIEELREYATEIEASSGELELDTVYDLGVRSLYDQYGLDGMMSSFDLGSFKVSQDGDLSKIYWSLNWPEYDYIENVTTGNYEEVLSRYMDMQFYFEIDNSDSEPTVLFLMTADSGSLKYYSFFDGNNMILDSYSMYDDEDGIGSWASYSYGTGDSLTLFEIDNGSDYNDKKIAYGDDSNGGLVSIYSWDNGGGSTYTGGRKEYFDNNGDLVMEEWGSEDSDPYWISYAESGVNIASAFGLGTAPDSIKVRDNNGTWEYSTDGGTNWVDPVDNIDLYNLHFKAGDNWAVGDCEYWWNDSDWDNATSTYTITMTKGNVIKVPEDYLGTDLQVSRNYPLKSILPLSGPKATTHEIKQLEGSTTNYDWDGDGSNDYSWTDYRFFLVPIGDTLDENIDFEIYGLNIQDYCSWNNNTNDWEDSKSYIFSSSDALPDYFSFTAQSTINSVETKLDNLYSGEFQTWLNRDYESEFNSFPSDDFYLDL
ncbi:MAG: hypothetical protein OCD02_05270 [Spirochaetaceae bacterium]